jgi:hypothetical protein
MEIWKDIKDYEGLYQVSNFGNIKSLERMVGCNGGFKKINEVLCKTKEYKNGYKMISLSKFSKSKTMLIHRLAAIAFIDNKGSNNVVNHKDGDRLNNRVDNLEWCSVRYNVTHSFRNKQRSSNYTGVNFTPRMKNKPWRCSLTDNKKRVHLGYFKTEIEASEAYNNYINK